VFFQPLLPLLMPVSVLLTPWVWIKQPFPLLQVCCYFLAYIYFQVVLQTNVIFVCSSGGLIERFKQFGDRCPGRVSAYIFAMCFILGCVIFGVGLLPRTWFLKIIVRFLGLVFAVLFTVFSFYLTTYLSTLRR
jgi:hypothetical protein